MTKILVVEDEPVLAEIIETILRMNGHEVMTAPDGETGLRRAASDRPQIILMDMSLPGITGFEAVRCLKRDMATKDIPVIALTAQITSGDRDEAYDAGVAGFVTKPFEHDHLLALIAQLAPRP